MNSLGVVLEQFTDEVVIYITDPRTGIQRRSKWPPTISEVIEACEDHQIHLEKLRNYRPISAARSPAPLLRDGSHGCCASIFVPEGHVRFTELVAWTKDEDDIALWKFGQSSDGRPGLWVSREAWETACK